MAYPVDWINTAHKGQDFTLDIGEMMEEYKLHIQVRHDSSYKHQSYGHVDVWHSGDLSWHRVADLIWSQINDAYEAAEELRSRAAAILLNFAS